MTDAEIIKALEWLKEVMGVCSSDDEYIYGEIILDLIKRQQSEIEKLQTMNLVKLDMIHDLQTELETAKTEAVKEFAEKLKELYETDGIITDDMKVPIEVIRANIDDVVEELVGAIWED